VTQNNFHTEGPVNRTVSWCIWTDSYFCTDREKLH